MFRPAFGCPQHPKAGGNTQQQINEMMWDHKTFVQHKEVFSILMAPWLGNTKLDSCYALIKTKFSKFKTLIPLKGGMRWA